VLEPPAPPADPAGPVDEVLPVATLVEPLLLSPPAPADEAPPVALVAVPFPVVPVVALELALLGAVPDPPMPRPVDGSSSMLQATSTSAANETSVVGTFIVRSFHLSRLAPLGHRDHGARSFRIEAASSEDRRKPRRSDMQAPRAQKSAV